MADNKMNASGKGGGNTPLYAVITIGIMVFALVVLMLLANPASAPSLPGVIAIFVAAIPALVSAVFSERASRDIRNGVVLEKAKEGARAAIAEIHSHGDVPLHSHNPEDEDPVLLDYPHSHGKAQ